MLSCQSSSDISAMRGVREDARVVQEDVQSSRALDGLVDEARGVRGVGDRRGDGVGRAALGLDRLCGAAQRVAAGPRRRVEVARGDDDGRTAPGHREGELTSDAAAAAGDERDLPGEVRGGHGSESSTGNPHPRPLSQRERGESCHSERSRGISRGASALAGVPPKRCFDFASGCAQHDNAPIPSPHRVRCPRTLDSRRCGKTGISCEVPACAGTTGIHSDAMERSGRVDWRMRQKRYWLA